MAIWRAAICAVERDEGRYLREWVAYHRVLGFDEVLVYENDSRDDSWEVLGQLEQHGLVTRVRWSVPDYVAPQKAAYADALRRLGPDFGWAAFIDLDEFVVLPRHDTIHDFLDEFGISMRSVSTGRTSAPPVTRATSPVWSSSASSAARSAPGRATAASSRWPAQR